MGGKVLVVLRPTEGKSKENIDHRRKVKYSYRVVGPAYVHGFMDSQLGEWVGRKALQVGIFSLYQRKVVLIRV